ncbi:MAG TPA: anti-sigma factor [Roseomonas sp.]|jgi:anti-sigma factor RsiW
MTEACAGEWRLLVQADMDGELTPAEAARLAAHLETCPACQALQDRLLMLVPQLKRGLTYHPAPEALRTALQARLGAAARSARPAAAPARAPLPARRWLGGARLRGAAMGMALAASLAFVLVLPRGADLPETVVAGHIRALQPGHLMDVVSTDQHTVKPWFEGRLDFAPPVTDLAPQGFPLAGGRLDYMAGRPVAALVYRRAQHVINLYVWPDGSHLERGQSTGSHSGYNYIRWNRDGMAFWAVSDLNPQELGDFVRLWQAQ